MAFSNDGPRREFKGNWKCSKCGKEITSLPFQPDENRLDSLKCRDCHMQDKGFGGGRR